MNKDTLVILVHGFNVRDMGDSTVNKLHKYFSVHDEVDVRVYSYGFTFFLLTRFLNEEIAEGLVRRITRLSSRYKRVIVVGHSNGCTIAHLASYALPLLDVDIDFIYLNPALKNHLVPAPQIRSVKVFHNEGDSAVKWSKLLFWRARERPWGEMGNTGYIGDDKRIKNFNTMKDFAIEAKGHSTIFEEHKVEYFGPKIAKISLSEI